MFEKSFKGINILEKSLTAAWVRNESISNNIANVNTPNFKRNVVNFESVLKDHLSNFTVEGKLTHKDHISVGNTSINNMNPVVSKDYLSKYRKDGNNVNIDVEMAELAKNTIQYNTLTQRISGKFSMLKSVIRDGR